VDRPLTSPGQPPAARTTLRRLPQKAVHDPAVRDAVLDAERVAHVGVLDGDTPFVLPVAYGRDDATDSVLFHGSTASRLFRALAAGAPTCFTVTVLDALVLARSAFETSLNYRSVMVVGTCTPVAGADKTAALHAISERLVPGRWDDVRGPSAKELAATTVLRLPLREWSVKVSDGPPDDPPEDLDVDTWAGVVPVARRFGTPLPAPDLRSARPFPEYADRWLP
jgi:nitroimidazol reductase NimA-like FMN-containing flavoprotein (pyridoxamine 5'-phosphate oxidase superfamily)